MRTVSSSLAPFSSVSQAAVVGAIRGLFPRLDFHNVAWPDMASILNDPVFLGFHRWIQLGAPARQGNVAQGQTTFVSLHKCPRLLLGHHQTHRPCKTTGPVKQHNMAEGQKSLVSLHGYFWMLLGHYTRGSCKTRQCSSGSNKFRVLAQVPRLLLGHHQTQGPCKTTQYG